MKRNCFCLSRPIDDEKLLRNIDKANYLDLSHDFKMELNSLITYVFSHVEFKMVGNKPVNGEGFSLYL